MKRRTTILVADDDPAIREPMAARLAAFGYEVTPSEHGDALLGACRADEVCAVVLACDRRREHGPSLVTELRGLVDVPIVFLSQGDREEFRDLVMRLPEVYMVPADLADGEVSHRLRSLVGPPTRQPAEAMRNRE